MGKTYHKSQNQRFDDEQSSGRSGKHANHANNRKTGGMKTLNSYVEEDYEDPFQDDLGLEDNIFIQHIKDDTN
jgi:hypothetical protein